MAHLFIHSVKYLYKAPSKKTAQMLSQLQHKDENIGEEVLEMGQSSRSRPFWVERFTNEEARFCLMKGEETS